MKYILDAWRRFPFERVSRRDQETARRGQRFETGKYSAQGEEMKRKLLSKMYRFGFLKEDVRICIVK